MSPTMAKPEAARLGTALPRERGRRFPQLSARRAFAGILAGVLPRFEPMLAASRPARVPPATWALEPKLDGWRALVYVEGGQVDVRTRRGRSITEQVPELAGLAEHLGRPCVLDGELVAGAGRPWDFYRVAPRLARRRDHLKHLRRLTFVAFDVLWLDDQPTVLLSYVERRQILDRLDVAGPAWATVGSFDEPVDEVMEACSALGLEGMVAKRTDSPYRPGVRSNDWLKVKTADWRAVHAPRRIDASR
jgi:bifunctional non-homologous end joining protein LigD